MSEHLYFRFDLKLNEEQKKHLSNYIKWLEKCQITPRTGYYADLKIIKHDIFFVKSLMKKSLHKW